MELEKQLSLLIFLTALFEEFKSFLREVDTAMSIHLEKWTYIVLLSCLKKIIYPCWSQLPLKIILFQVWI